MDIDPYKTLGVPRNFTLEQLKSSYKKIALSVHPDKTPGNSDYMFKIVTKCYKKLSDEFKARESDKQYNELKSEFMKTTETQKKYVNPDIDISKKFNIKQFNQVFDDNRIPTVTDSGYKEWMDKNELRDAPDLGKNITKESFNEQFERYADETKDKKNKYIIKYREPEALQMSKKLNYIELGTENIDDYSGENKSNRDLNFMDYRIAHSTTRLVDPNAVKERTQYKTVGEYEKSRTNIKKLSDKELAYIEKKKQLELLEEKKKEEYQKTLDQLTFENFKKLNKLMLGQK